MKLTTIEGEDIKELRSHSVGCIDIGILKSPKTRTAAKLENSNEPRANIKIFQEAERTED